MKGKKILSLMLAVMLVLGALPAGLSFTAAAADASGVSGGIAWEVDRSTLTISVHSSSNMLDYSDYGAPWQEYANKIFIVRIADGVTSIGSNAFYDLTNVSLVTIPGSVTSIGKDAFHSCRNLRSVTIPEGVTTIEDYAFATCGYLTSVTIPRSVTQIEYAAFAYCKKLATVNYTGGGADWNKISIADNAFNDTPANRIVRYYYGVQGTINAIDDIGANDGSNAYKVRVAIAFAAYNRLSAAEQNQVTNADLLTGAVNSLPVSSFGTCGVNTAYVLGQDAYVLIGGVGATGDDPKATTFCDDVFIMKLLIEEGVTSVGEGMFDSCLCLELATLPKSLKAIGSRAFAGCEELTDIYYAGGPADWEKIAIAADAFDDLSALTIHYYYGVAGTINAINDIGTVEHTDACKARIDAARKAYDSLSDYETTQVTNYQTLTDAEAEYARLEAALPKAIRLGAGALDADKNTANAATVHYGGNPWRVIGYDGAGVASESGTVTLLAAVTLGDDCNFVPRMSYVDTNEYGKSCLALYVGLTWSNSSSAERSAIKMRTLASGSYDGENTDCVAGDAVEVFSWPLSTREAKALNGELRTLGTAWWLRSPGVEEDRAANVGSNGWVNYRGDLVSVNGPELGVRPAFWLDLNKVLFASAAENGKTGDGLTAVGGYTGSDWKLTLLDESRSGFTAKCTKIENGVYTIQYSGAATGTNEKISAMIVDEDGIVTYYGVLEAAKAGENTLTLDVSGKLGDGDKLYIFNEQTNGDKKTDYASNLVDVTEVFHYKVGDTLQYGTYPQSEVTDAATVAALNAKLRSNGWISYGYYIGTGGYNGTMAPDDFMRYQDVVLDGVKYRAVTFDCYRPAATADTSSADNSNQDENGYESGDTYWFKFEPVTWKVLDPESGLVLCCSAIDNQAYHNYVIAEFESVYHDYKYWGDPDQKYRANDYAHSDIRAWLNEDFINTAFSAAQQENIKVSELDDDSTHEGYDYASSADKIFLLSLTEATSSAYGFDPNGDSMDPARQMSFSDYAKCQGICEGAAKHSFWWLRDYCGNDTVRLVSAVGTAGISIAVPSATDGVVPAMRMQELQDDPTGAPLKVTMEIANYDELKAFASAVNGGQTGLKAILKSDIAATDKDWTPIGNKSNPYIGAFDGGGHTITGLSNEEAAATPDSAGLFGYLGENAKVKNVRLTGVDLKATYYLGAVAGDAKGAEITNCRNTGEINCTASQVGGIIGSIRGAIVSNCCNTGDITSTANNAYVGGIAGFLCGDQSAAGITNCYNTGTVTGKGKYSNVGGIAGYANDMDGTVEIANCYNTGAVTATGTSSRAGGIAASSCVFGGGTVEVINCYSAGAVTADERVGGVIGLKYNSVVRNCYYDSDVCGLSSAIGKIDDTDDVKGLHTDEMTGASALTQMPFSDPSAWLVKGTTNLYEFYPHLKGFDFNADGSQKEASAIDAADWPAKIAHSHTYGEPVWSWEKDHSKATATFTCSGCGDEQTVTDEEIDVTVVSAADCTNDRVVTYTAGVTFAGAPYENAVKNVTLPDTATGHTYGDTGDDRFTCTVCGAEDAARKAAAALADAKAAAKTELENYKDPADYRADEQTDLAAAIADGEAAIDAAADIDAVNTALTAAKAVIDAIKTDAQLAAEELAADTAAADAVEAKIDAIGEVAYTDESKAKIDDARAAYDDLTDKQKALVDNKDTLETAEEAYQLLEDKDNFEQYKDELKQAAEDKRKDGDSDESKKLIDDAIAAIDAMEYDESKSLDENKAAVDDAAKLDDLAADLTDQRAADEVEKKINDIGNVALTDESKQKIDDARAAYDDLTADQKALVGNKNTLETAEEAYQLLEDKDNFEQYKDELKQAAEDKRKDDDSDESKKLIDDAIAAIDAMEYDESKSLDENKAAVDTAANLDQLAADLTDRRAADDVEKKINDIGTVALTDESKQKIDDAREAYNNLTDAQKALVDNEDTLKTAEEVYQLLEDKDNFEQYKDELKQAAEDKRKDGDSAESKKLIDDAIAAIDAMEYDERKSLDENKAAVDDAADLDKLAQQLEEHREIHYAVFKADGAEIARVPYTIDTKAITAPAVPVKGGYTGAWPGYELKAGGVEINAVYTKNGALVITDNAKEQGEGRALTFKETVTFTTDTSALPEGAKLCWYVNGEAVTAEKSVTVEAPKDDYTVQVKAFAKDGTLYAESDVLTVKVDHSFWAKLVYFFNLAFGPVTDALKKVVPSFFSFLIALIKAIATALIAAVKSVI